MLIENEIKKACQVRIQESPTNPTLKIVDIQRLANVAREHGGIVIVEQHVRHVYQSTSVDVGCGFSGLQRHKYRMLARMSSGRAGGRQKSLIRTIFHYREITGATLHAHSAI